MDHQTDTEHRIRERAHALWEAEGRPEGKREAHWEQARREIAAEDETAPSGGAHAEADRSPEGGTDRPGMDLGGASEEGREGPNETIPGGPRTDAAPGSSGEPSSTSARQSSGAPAGRGPGMARRP